MKLIECLIDGYKNLKQVEIYPCGGINVVYGANAQGKTNLIEAISLFSGRDRLRRRPVQSARWRVYRHCPQADLGGQGHRGDEHV